jgi:hypothetical protein
MLDYQRRMKEWRGRSNLETVFGVTSLPSDTWGTGKRSRTCELAAGKRWISRHGEAYRHLKPTLLGDDLYSHEPFCRPVVEAGRHFIFTCKDSTHPWLRETVEHSEKGEVSRREWKSRYHLVYTYRWVNGVPIRYEEKEADAFSVSHLSPA